MNPHVEIKLKKKNILLFTVTDINVSFANALRRIILSEIPTVVIRSFPYEKNDVMIDVNTSRLNNEILKQRLSCIPIHIKDRALTLEELGEYEVEVDKKNTSDKIEFITSEDFKIKHNEKLLPPAVVHKIFPPDPFTKDYILFARLRPKISEDMPGEELKLTAKFSRGIAKETSMFNVVSTCSYAMTPDLARQYDIWQKQETILSSQGLDDINIEMEKKNWLLGDAKRIYTPDSFDFIIETLGVFTTKEIMHLTIEILNKKLEVLQEHIENGTLPIKRNQGATAHSFDITLIGEDYTIGKSLEYILHQQFYLQSKTLSYIGFLKQHPHDVDSLIRMVFKEDVDMGIPLQYLSEAIRKALEIFGSIATQFN